MKIDTSITIAFNNVNEVNALKNILEKITPINQEIKTLTRNRLTRKKIVFTDKEKRVLRGLQRKLKDY